MENKTASVLILATILYPPSLHAETNSPLTQLSAGDQSPVIKANNATFNYGLTETTLNALLEQHEDRLIKRLLAASGDKKERLVLEKQLKAVQEQKADLKKTLEEEIQRRKNADEALAKLYGQLPPARLEAAAKLLQKGDTTAAEQLFEEVVRKEGKDVALAAYQNGQLAEGRLDYAKAMRQYRKAVALEENNLDYLLAGAKVSRTLADYDQAQEWLERLLTLKEQEGTSDLILSDILKELASLYHFRGFYEKAEILYNRSLAITEKILGKENPEVATVLKDMAALYEIQARYEDAESLYKRAQKIVGKPSKRIIPTRPIPQLPEEKTNIDSVTKIVIASNSIGNGNIVRNDVTTEAIYYGEKPSFREVTFVQGENGNPVGVTDNPNILDNAIKLITRIAEGEDVDIQEVLKTTSPKFFINSGTEISRLESSGTGFAEFIKVKILEGPHKGKTGWIHACTIHYELRKK